MVDWMDFSFLYICLCALLGLVAAIPAGINPGIVYANAKQTTVGSPFQNNLNKVLGLLFSETPGNGNATCAYEDDPDTVYGFSECYNMSQEGCDQCLNIVRDNINTTYPPAVGAQMWWNDTNYRCYLHYENFKFVQDVVGSPPKATSTPRSSKSGSSSKVGIIMGAILGVAILCGGLYLCWKRRKSRKSHGLEGSIEGPLVYSYEELRIATRNFHEEQKLGEGAFGAVFKGVLYNGSEAAVKKLSTESSHKTLEFVNEINIITGIQHRHLARLKGYCVEGKERLLVLEFHGNGSLDHALFGSKCILDWSTRYNIAIGIAKGLSYLHEESHIQIIHRDIKVSNILLDDKLNARISDFGISKLFDEKNPQSTRIAGTRGYLAPEYALHGELTVKADVYSFGVVVLEIVSGRRCLDFILPTEQRILIQWAWNLYKSDNLEELVDKKLERNFSKKEAVTAIHIALLCVDNNPDNRPKMSLVVAMFSGYIDLPHIPTNEPFYKLDYNSKSDYSTSVPSASSTFFEAR